MRTTTLGRLLGAAALAASVTLVTTGTASASTPNWSMKVTNLPPTVASGSALGYQVTISNGGPSNISQLFLVTETTDAPAYAVTSQGSCATATGLDCTLGALNAGKSLTVTVAYNGPVSGTYNSGDPVFQANSNGLTYSDGGTSHGDTLTDPNETPTQISADTLNFAGGFSLHGQSIHTNDSLGDGNKQATYVTPPASDLVVTAQDGPSVSFPCKTLCSTPYGEWSAINVGNGQKFSTYFPVGILIRASDLPNNLGKLGFVHVLDDGSAVLLKQCAKNAPLQNCITVTPTGTNVLFTAYLNQNGGGRIVG
jgi:hypothetical protein